MHDTALTRRWLLMRGAAWTACAASSSWLAAAPRFPRNPFSLGVMSGDPTSDGFVLWTRLAPDPLNGGGMAGQRDVEVRWQIAEDEGMRRVVRKGKALAWAQLGHSVHAEIGMLRPGRPYWYRFHVGREQSPVGRAITAPAAGVTPPKLKFAVASCQHWEAGLWTAYRHMLAESPDLVVHLGDYIYEGKPGTAATLVRHHNSEEIASLADYRNRHALYKSDPLIQAMHRHCPWLVTFDDHEVDNNYAGDIPEDKQTRADFLERRANAYQAYYEHMPLRMPARPDGSKIQIFRRAAYGDLAAFHILDTRQYRTDQPCGDGLKPPCEATFDNAATLLGARQEAWLHEGLSGSRARWNIVANQVMVARVDLDPAETAEALSADQWSGYEASRRRFLEFLRDRQPSNPVVITGDIHSNWVSDLKVNWKDEKSPAVASEFVGTSISSGGDGSEDRPNTPAWYRENPHLKMFNARRGYVTVTLDAAQCRADYRVLDYVTKPDAPIRTHSSWVVQDGRRGVTRL